MLLVVVEVRESFSTNSVNYPLITNSAFVHSLYGHKEVTSLDGDTWRTVVDTTLKRKVKPRKKRKFIEFCFFHKNNKSFMILGKDSKHFDNEKKNNENNSLFFLRKSAIQYNNNLRIFNQYFELERAHHLFTNSNSPETVELLRIRASSTLQKIRDKEKFDLRKIRDMKCLKW